MVMEKVHAMFEACASLRAGGTASSVVDRYRETSPQTRNDCHIRFYGTWLDKSGRAGDSRRNNPIKENGSSHC